MSELITIDKLRTLYRGDARDMNEIPDNSVHCIITSPPYFGLRRYDGPEQVWGGETDCEHEWQNIPPRRARRASDIKNPESKEATNRGNLGIELPHTNTCLKCGGWRGQLGAEPAPDLYIEHLMQIMQEIKRILRPDGQCWVNIADSMAGGKGKCFNPGGGNISFQNYLKENSALITERPNKSDLDDWGIKPLDLILIPDRFALACQANGWYVRSAVVWAKNNPMPESVDGWRWERHWVKVGKRGRSQAAQKGHFQDHSGNNVISDAIWQDCPGCDKCSPNDGFVLRKGSWRPTNSYEFVFQLTKTNKYYSDKMAVMEDGVYPSGETRKAGNNHKYIDSGARASASLHWNDWTGNGKRNLRSVWYFPTKSYGGEHYAVFPEKLPEICIKASTPEGGCCPECGAPWARVLKHEKGWDGSRYGENAVAATGGAINGGTLLSTLGSSHGQQVGRNESLGWRPTCKCQTDKPPVPATVLDPFAGSGTTLLVAAKLGRRAIGYEISEKYCRLIMERNRQGAIGLV